MFSPENNKSVISYDPSKPDTLQSILDWSKTEKELGYHPEYTFIKMMQDIKNEMKEEPFAQLWGNSEYYENMYGESK